jgi:threonine dehydrogenase-like Zn-dependent dehydrogenase
MGAGVDLAFETAGVQSSFNTALMTVKPHGCLVNVAIWQESPTVNMNLLNAREIRLTGTSSSRLVCIGSSRAEKVLWDTAIAIMQLHLKDSPLGR